MVLDKNKEVIDVLFDNNQVWQIIILASLKERNKLQLEKLKGLVGSESVNWEDLFITLLEQKVSPLVINNLIKYVNDEIPQSIKENLSIKMKKMTFFHFNKIKQLKNCLFLLQKHNIDVIPWKGALLSEELYGSFNLRQSGDIDLIIEKKNLYKAKEVLSKEGYISLWKMNDEHEELYIKNRHSYEMIKANHVDVELHWRLAKEQYLLDISMANFWNNSNDKEFYGIPIKYPTQEYLLLGLAIHHGGVEGWLKYKLIVDLYYLIKKYPDMDWDKVLALSTKLGMLRIILVGVCLCHRLFSTEIPIQLKSKVSKKELKIAEEILSNLLNGEISKQSSLLVRIRENRLQQIKMFIKIFMTPSLIDVYSNSSDKSTYISLVLNRPLRLIRKFILKKDDSIVKIYSNRGE